MKSGRPLKSMVYAYHGRPHCCARAMWVKEQHYEKHDRSFSQVYRCGLCRRTMKLYFTATGELHPNQNPRAPGRIPLWQRRPITPQHHHGSTRA